MKILLVSGEYPPMKGGVGRYTHNLSQALKRKQDVEVSVAVNAAHPSDEAGVHRVIKKGDRKNSDRLLDLVNKLEPDIVNVQYERGLYEIDTSIRRTASRALHGSTLDRFYRQCPAPVVSTLHTVFPYQEYRQYTKERARRKEGRFGFLPTPLRAGIRSYVMKKRYDVLMQVVQLSAGIISPAETIRDVVKRGTVIYHGAEPAVPLATASSKEQLRSLFGLPLDRKLLLAFGYAGSYKGFDVLDGVDIPKGWSIVVKQTKHERGVELPVKLRKDTISLHLDYLDDAALSKLFFACDAMIFPYRVVSISGVLFDALAHGLPFVASDLQFFREFADMGLGVVCSRDPKAFGEAIRQLDVGYLQYRRNAERFAARLCWQTIAGNHVDYFSRLLQETGRQRNYSIAG
jgi:glycosyltransferase involved in cell wall biosynthesis